jgi:hypothetical protein
VFVQNLTSTNELQVYWGQIPRDDVNGILIGHVLKYKLVMWMDDNMNDQEEKEQIFGPNEYSTTLKQLLVDGIYKLGVAAFTRKGRGPFASVYGSKIYSYSFFFNCVFNYMRMFFPDVKPRTVFFTLNY